MQLTKLTLLGAIVGTTLLSGAVSAQDMTDWSGFYAGVFAGYGLDTAVATSSSTGPLTIETDPGEFLTFGENSYQTRFESLLGGVQAGYNHQVNNFVLGVEGTVGIGGLKKTNASSATYNFVDGADFANNTLDNRTDFSVDWLTTFAARVGVDLDGWLVYGKAGVVVADISAESRSGYTLDSNVGAGLGGPLPNGTYSSAKSYSGLRGGAVLGVGLEKMLNANVSLGVEYSYINMGNVEVPSGGLLGGLLGGGGPQTFSANLHTINASLNYHF